MAYSFRMELLEVMEAGKFNKKADDDIADSAAEPVRLHEKNPKSLKAKPNDVSKSSSQEFMQSKEAETVSEVKAKYKNKRKRNKRGKQDRNVKTDSAKDLIPHHRDEAMEITKDKGEESKRREQKSGKIIGGMIFMCNAKTKPDCFRYRVMGIPTSRQELVMRIKPGLKLFLFDFDLKLMYGIYEASSSGGMKLEPAAFSGAFSAQVRFKICKDCLPLPEGVFKKAIKENYDEKTHKFKTELTVEQVKKLTELFHPAPWLPPNGKASGTEIVPVPVVWPPPSLSTLPEQEIFREQVYKEQYGTKTHQRSMRNDDDHHHIMPNNGHSSRPLFLSEKEYRSFGLRSERHFLPTTAPAGLPTSHMDDNHRFNNGREQLPSNPISLSNNAALVQKGPGCHNIYFPSEKEYRTYGLRGCHEVPSRQTPTLETKQSFEDPIKDVCNPYDDSTTSLVNRYLSLPGPVATPKEPFYLESRGAHVNGSSYARETKDHLQRLNSEVELSHPLYASHALSDYNRNYHRLGGGPDFTSSKVSSRYGFDGPLSRS
ncbi:unnamed protein product [Coffea canephora]|uniref:DCD domain-containing protein n=2 Tax=Coffea TaxID=13442 RepID=A0A068U5W0_COFCA|nr:unnamed protein product [Coffea canephora]